MISVALYQWAYTDFTQLLFVCATACAASLCVALVARIFVPSGGYAKDIIDALGLLKDFVRLATTRTIDPPLSAVTRSSSPTLTATSKPTSYKAVPTLEALQKSCREASLALSTSYDCSTFELRIGRVHISKIEPLIATVERIREELVCGVVYTRTHPLSDRKRANESVESEEHTDNHLSTDELGRLVVLDDTSHSCTDAIEDSITTLQAVVGLCYGIRLPGTRQPNPQSSVEMNVKEESSDLKKLKFHDKESAAMEEEWLFDLRVKGTRLVEARVALQEAVDSVDRAKNHAHISRWQPRYVSDS